MAKTATGYVCKFEVTDDAGGSRWNFFIGGQPVRTGNAEIAGSIRLAIETSSQVYCVYDDANGNAITQVQIVFRYVCEPKTVQPCEPTLPPQHLCVTHRYSPCDSRIAAICDDISAG
jgi:hypothetical protein